MRARMLLLTWIVATAAATGLAWLGVRSVLGGVATPLPAPAIVAGDEPAAEVTASEDAATPAAPRTTTRTFTLTGGTATVRFSPDEVIALSAVPAAGYDADVETDRRRNRVEFEFESDTHQSSLDAWWDDGPRHRIREAAEDDDRDDADD